MIPRRFPSSTTGNALSRAKAKGVKIGRPRLAAELRHEITRRAATGETAYAIAKALRIDRHTAAKYLQS
jgi:DNA invertase Pin-like site-specific DNA recombinase